MLLKKSFARSNVFHSVSQKAEVASVIAIRRTFVSQPDAASTPALIAR